MQDDESQQAMVAPINWRADGKVWINSAEEPIITRFDVSTGKFEPWRFPSRIGRRASRIRIWNIHKLAQQRLSARFPQPVHLENRCEDRRTTSYKTPSDYSRPRRGRMDDQDRLWFAEWRADKIAMFDTKSGEFMEFRYPDNIPRPMTPRPTKPASCGPTT